MTCDLSRFLRWTVAFGLLALCFPMARRASAEEPARARVLIALASYRARPKHPRIYFYEHDGVASGKIVGMVGGTPAAVDDAYAHPSLSQDGKLCAYTYERENNTGRINLWDLSAQKNVELPPVVISPNAQMAPALAGTRLAFTAWSRPGGAHGWHVFLHDLAAKKMVELPDLHGAASDEQMPALSGDGRFLAYVTNARIGVGLSDVFLYDCTTAKVLPMPAMNSKHRETEPALSGDGSLVAFSSDRPGGNGGRDIYLFDRKAEKFLALPGLNTGAHEYSPSLSPDGRFLVFVSERVRGEGERDVYLYDRQAGKLLPTPGLNSRSDDFDPCVVVLKDLPR